MGYALREIGSVIGALIGLAALAVLVSRNANTTGVTNSLSSAFNSGLATAEGPVTGYSPGPPIYANQNALGFSMGSGSIYPNMAIG